MITEMSIQQEIAYTKAISYLVKQEQPITDEDRETLTAEWCEHSYDYVIEARDYNRRKTGYRIRDRSKKAQETRP
jgi:hypothetical protein